MLNSNISKTPNNMNALGMQPSISSGRLAIQILNNNISRTASNKQINNHIFKTPSNINALGMQLSNTFRTASNKNAQ